MTRAQEIAEGLTGDERRCLLSPRAPVPDSIWHGHLHHLKTHAGCEPHLWRWSPLGLEVRAILQETDRG